MKKNADSTPRYDSGTTVKVAGQEGVTKETLEDGRVVVQFKDGHQQPIEPDKIQPR